jgi:hypothetical protein
LRQTIGRANLQAAFRLGCLLAFVESGIADLAESFQVADQGPDITPGDIVRPAVETLGAQGREPRQNGVDLGLPLLWLLENNCLGPLTIAAASSSTHCCIVLVAASLAREF